MSRPSVLFLCTGNSCRSQMAEGWLRHLAGDSIDARSAGVEAYGLNPHAVAGMAEAGVDINGQRSELVVDHLADPPDIVFTVCDDAAEHCPDLPPRTRMFHRQFFDPARAVAVRAAVVSVSSAVGCGGQPDPSGVGRPRLEVHSVEYRASRTSDIVWPPRQFIDLSIGARKDVLERQG